MVPLLEERLATTRSQTISSSYLALGGGGIATLLANPFNLAVHWKTSTIIFIHKEGTRVDPANWRPITLTPVISRIMERLVKKKLTTSLMDHKLVNISQHGFPQNTSCKSLCGTAWIQSQRLLMPGSG